MGPRRRVELNIYDVHTQKLIKQVIIHSDAIGSKLYTALHEYNLSTTPRDSAQVNEAGIRLHQTLMNVINQEVEQVVDIGEDFYEVSGVKQIVNTLFSTTLNVYVKERA